MKWRYVILVVALTLFSGLADSRAFQYATQTWPNDQLDLTTLGRLLL
jgi:hypothetical protein